jgi:hypothetical protein
MPPHDDVSRVRATVASADHGLHTYQLKPEGMRGEELFAHMIQFRENHNWNKGKELDSSGVMVLPGKYIYIKVKPDIRKVLKAATEVIVGSNITAKRNILQYAFGNSSAKIRIPKCMLDQFSLIKSHSDIVNSEPNLKRMKSQVMMAKLLG